MTPAEKCLLRLVLSLVVGAACTAVLWSLVPDQLSASTDIVGFPIFADFDIYRYVYGYYFIAFLFPLTVIGLFQLTAWKGPLRFEGSGRPAVFPLKTVPEAGYDDSGRGNGDNTTRRSAGHVGEIAGAPEASQPGVGERDGPITIIGTFWIGARIVLPVVTVLIELAVIQSPNHPTSSVIELLAAAVYLAAVLLFTLGFRFFTPGSGLAHADKANPQRTGSSTVRTSLARANSLVAIAVVPLLYFVSRSTSVGVGSRSHLVHYPWLPWWLVTLLTLLCLFLWLWRDLRATGPDASHGLEAGILTWAVGPVLLFLVVAVFPGAFGTFGGFDDAQFLAAPQLIFYHGLFPWRDIYVLHGLLADVFDGKIGMVLFGNTRWGANAGTTLIVYPASWIVLYGFAAYFCRRNRLLLAGLTVALACGLIQGTSVRFLLLPLFFVTFDAVLRRPTWPRSWLFMATLFIGAILTPEETLFLPCLLIPLVLFEVTGRTRGTSMTTSFPRTWRCGIAGSVLVLAWIGMLVATSSLTAFFDYFRVFSSGHDLEGGLPAGVYLFGSHYMVIFAWTMPVVLWLATVWRVVAKLRMRRTWTVTDWVLMAAAATSVIYYPKALGRADVGHIQATFWVSLPLLFLWSVVLLSEADRATRSLVKRLPTRNAVLSRLGVPQLRHVATFAALAVVLAGTTTQVTTVAFVLRQPRVNFHPTIPADAVSVLPRLGYTVPGSVDTAQIRELQSVLERYAGPSAPIFDYSNEPGILNYLLDRTPGTRYYYAAVVQTPLAQQQDIAELQKSRPPVVLFSNTTFGLIDYDGIPQALRSYDVSTYLYAHYRPLLDVQGQLLLLRDDLSASAPPVPAGLATTDLYFDTLACTFGDIPNYFALPSDIATRPRVTIPVTQQLHVPTTTVTGWAVDAVTKAPVTQVLAVAGGHVVAATEPSRIRVDVIREFHNFASALSGYTIHVYGAASETFDLYALNADSSVTPLTAIKGTGSGGIGAAPLSAVVTRDGHTHPVVTNAVIGKIDSVTTVPTDVTTLRLPSGVSTTSYHWLELTAPAALGIASFTLTDDLGALVGHNIAFNTLPRVGKHVYVGVGSCLQWQGYGAAHQLYLKRSGRKPPMPISVTLVK